MKVNAFCADTCGAGLSVPSTSSRSLPSPSITFTTSTVLTWLSLVTPCEPKLTLPKLMPPGKTSVVPPTDSVPSPYSGPVTNGKTRSGPMLKPVSEVSVRTPVVSALLPSLKMFSTSICWLSGGCAPMAIRKSSVSPGSLTPLVSDRSAPEGPPSTASGPRMWDSRCDLTGNIFTPSRVVGTS